ncbi:MAG: ABC transporter ATP-binding protein [Williamsia sp.]|nr:ABC transporter ATP-binding protein [Williamsia sp.]
MIVAEHLSKYFGAAKAVDDISFTVQEGENFVFLGTSGCGKTTTLRMINRLIEPSAGSISVRGENVLNQQPEKLRRSIGYVLQHNGLFPHYTVAENIAVVPALLGMPVQQIRRRTEELLEKLRLPPAKYMNAYPAQLSGGQQQRVGIARALAADPPLLLMDEPFGALDTISRTAIRKELSELDEFKRKTILLVTHDVQEAFALAHKICLMDRGKIVQLGTPADLLFRPATPFVSAFLEQEKMQLSLKSVRLEALWNYLPDAGSAAPPYPANISGNTTLWDALEMVYTQSDQPLFLPGPAGEQGRLKQAGPAELLAAGAQWSKQQAATAPLSPPTNHA